MRSRDFVEPLLLEMVLSDPNSNLSDVPYPTFPRHLVHVGTLFSKFLCIDEMFFQRVFVPVLRWMFNDDLGDTPRMEFRSV